MKFSALALISAVACATEPKTEVKTEVKSQVEPKLAEAGDRSTAAKAPVFTPSTVNTTQLATVALSLQWPYACSKDDEPTVKLSIDEQAVKDKASLSANLTTGFKIQGTAGDKNVEISANKPEADVKKDNFTRLVYISDIDVKAEAFNVSLLYFGQFVVPNKTVDTTFTIEYLCKDKEAKKQTAILKVNGATASAALFAASFAAISSYLLL